MMLIVESESYKSGSLKMCKGIRIFFFTVNLVNKKKEIK